MIRRHKPSQRCLAFFNQYYQIPSFEVECNQVYVNNVKCIHIVMFLYKTSHAPSSGGIVDNLPGTIYFRQRFLESIRQWPIP